MNDSNPTAKQIVGEAYTKYYNETLAIFLQARIPLYICEDMVQDVFEKLLAIDIIDQARVKSLVAVIAYHIRTDYLRRRAMYRNRVEKDITRAMSTVYNDHTVACREIEAIEMDCCNRLNTVDSKVYKLSRYENKDTKEIAMIMDITPRAAEGHLFRARKKVREDVRMAING